MVDLALPIHLAAAFAIGALWVIVITVIAEKKGSVLGGVLGGLPSTSAFSFFFIGIYQSSTAAVQATAVFPLAFAVTSAYLFFFAYFAQKGFSRGLIIALLMWFTVSGLIVASGFSDFTFALVGGTLISVLTYVFFTKKLKLKNLEGEQRLYRFHEVALRGVGAGALVSFSVLLSQIGNPIVGGIAAAFPAVFTSTLIILNRSRGTEFSRAITKPLVFSGILTIIPYCVTVRFLYPVFGVLTGSLLAYGVVVPLAVLSYYASKH